MEVLDKYFGHLAPWNYAYHSYDKDGKIFWDGKLQDLVYCHFSNFKPNYKDNTYIMAPRHGIQDTTNTFIKNIYDIYFDCLRRVND